MSPKQRKNVILNFPAKNYNFKFPENVHNKLKMNFWRINCNLSFPPKIVLIRIKIAI